MRGSGGEPSATGGRPGGGAALKRRRGAPRPLQPAADGADTAERGVRRAGRRRLCHDATAGGEPPGGYRRGGGGGAPSGGRARALRGGGTAPARGPRPPAAAASAWPAAGRRGAASVRADRAEDRNGRRSAQGELLLGAQGGGLDARRVELRRLELGKLLLGGGGGAARRRERTSRAGLYGFALGLVRRARLRGGAAAHQGGGGSVKLRAAPDASAASRMRSRASTPGDSGSDGEYGLRTSWTHRRTCRSLVARRVGSAAAERRLALVASTGGGGDAAEEAVRTDRAEVGGERRRAAAGFVADGGEERRHLPQRRQRLAGAERRGRRDAGGARLRTLGDDRPRRAEALARRRALGRRPLEADESTDSAEIPILAT